MDIESAECRALKNSTQFFNKVKVHVIFMEFTNYKKSAAKPVERKCILDMVANLRSMGFTAWAIDPTFQFHGKHELLDKNMGSWPGDIVWIRHKPS